MSVYTALSENDFSEIFSLYSLGECLHFQGIEAGIENTNYFVSTTQGEYVLTLFEKINLKELSFYLSLLQQLTKANIPCPIPQINKNGFLSHQFKTKPLTIVSRLNGSHPDKISTLKCCAIAEKLALLHNTPLYFTHRTANRCGRSWRLNTAQRLLNTLPKQDALFLQTEIQQHEKQDYTNLPAGVIHGDLFRDNTLFETNKLTGIIDFYDACFDSYLYDMAITVNDWCTDKEGKLREHDTSAFLRHYQVVRPLSDTEKKAWPMMLRIAAMRFWLSRLEAFYTPRSGHLTHRKNPAIYLQILQHHIQADYEI